MFIPDLTNQAQEAIYRMNLTFDNSHLSQAESKKHLGSILDSKLNFIECLRNVLDKRSKTIGLMCKFQPILLRFSLLTIYKTFIRPHLDCRGIIYDQTTMPGII